VQKGGLLEMSRKIRMRLLFDDWPAEDRKRWESAFQTGDRFDESGPGAHLAESTRRVWQESHARFLGFISTHRQDLMHVTPRARIDRLIVADYVAWRRKSCGEVSIAIDLDHLRGALKLICPGDRLYALGLELMDGAVTDADAAKHISKAHAIQYRDGLIIAFLALIPVRSRTLVAMRIGIHLVKTGELWGLDIPAADTKSQRPLDYPIPRELSAHIDLYLERFRSRIPGAERHTAPWASNQGRPMCARYWPHLADRRKKLMSKHQTTAHDTSATSKQVRGPTDVELTADELEHVWGGGTKGTGTTKPQEFLTYTMSNIMISSYSVSSS
jgi:integrase/recombinase XerD